MHPAIARRDDAGTWRLGFSGAASEGDAGYRGFEDIFRGSEAEITERQRRYVPLFRGADWVLDLGCGRGEFLDVLRDEGIAARGIDLDPTMVQRCREKGHDVERSDAITYLSGLEDGTLPAAFAAQVIEHLPPDVLQELLALLRRKLVPGGIAVLETVNPHSPPALKAFWTDITHQHPLFPEVSLALVRLAGFDDGEVLFPDDTGDFERDVYENRDYAVVARTAR
jgi:SAM-dependent methyltransferase